MYFKIDEKIFAQYPSLKIGVIVVRGINNSRRISSIESLLRGISAQRGKEFTSKDISENHMVDIWNRAYGMFGIHPKKYLPSIAALLKRVANGKQIPHINPIVDLYNYFSLKYLLPIGGEDLDWLCGDLQLTFTKGGEAFRPLGSIEIEKAGEGEVAYMDNGGITCRYWNYRECERTKFTNKTVNAAIIVEDLSNMHMDQFGAIIREMEDGIIKYIGGQIEPYLLNQENPEIDFRVEGRKNADDSRIPAQEKVYFMEMEQLKKTEDIS
ncbi:hypothetical protein HZC20_03910 [Candidatus Peregrinibacteria bacterium]|nr:hypothetical protein [Candidatus Peregrinibacteria bacterium]